MKIERVARKQCELQAEDTNDPTPIAAPATGGTTGSDRDAASVSEIKDPEALLAAYTRQKTEYAETKKLLAKYDADKKIEDDKKLSETQLLTKRAAELEAQLAAEKTSLKDRINAYEVQLAASRLGIVDPEAAVKLLDWSDVEYKDDGTPKNIDKMLTKMLEKRPWLKGTPVATPGTPTNPSRSSQSGSLTRDDLKRMSAQEIMKYPHSVIRQILSGG